MELLAQNTGEGTTILSCLIFFLKHLLGRAHKKKKSSTSSKLNAQV
jgi:hypothetical protein